MTSDGAPSLRLLADENVQGALVQALRRDGLDVAYVAEGACGITDGEVLHLAVTEKRIVLTEDKDFGDLVFRLQRRVPGLILMRFSGFHRTMRQRRLRALIDHYGHGLYGRYVLVTAERFRLRKLPEPST